MVLRTPASQCTQLRKASFYILKFKDLAGGCEDPFALRLLKTSLVCKFPLLIKPATTQPGVACLSLVFPCPPNKEDEAVSDFTQEQEDPEDFLLRQQKLKGN